MSDPVRLMEEGADEFELELLRSAAKDVGSERLMKRTLGAVAAASALTAAGAAGQAAAISKASALFGASKWIAALVIAGSGAALAIHASRPVPERAQAVASIAPAASSAATRAMEAPAEAARTTQEGQAPPAATSATEEPPAARPKRPEPRHPAPASPIQAEAASSPPGARPPDVSNEGAPPAASARDARSSLAAEVHLLDRARAALARGDASGALRELDRHRVEFPRGALGPEVTVLRIEALARSGDRAAAEKLAERYLGSSPNAAHSTRIRSVLKPERTSHDGAASGPKPRPPSGASTSNP
jgi:hypothetical protein